jgi:hypothetical protein
MNLSTAPGKGTLIEATLPEEAVATAASEPEVRATGDALPA